MPRRSHRWQRCAPGPCPHVQRWRSARSNRRCVCPRSSRAVAPAASRFSNDTPSSGEYRRANPRDSRGEVPNCVDDLVTVSHHLRGNRFHIFLRLGIVRSSPASARVTFNAAKKENGATSGHRVELLLSEPRGLVRTSRTDRPPTGDYLARRQASRRGTLLTSTFRTTARRTYASFASNY